MSDERYKDMVISHDKHIDTLAASIKNLAGSVGATNNKLDDVIDVINQQNILVERMNNLDHNVAESFNRAWGRLAKLETVTETGGCNPAKGLQKEKELYDEKLKVADKRMGTAEDDLKGLSERMGATVPGTIIKWVLGLLLFYSVAFGTYVVDRLHVNDTVVQSYIAKNTQQQEHLCNRVNDIITLMRDNGRIITHSTGPGTH